MAIIATLIGIATPATVSALRGSQLSRGSLVVGEQLHLARQTALTKNRSVEVRFYQIADSSAPGEQPSNPSTGKFRTMQLFEIQESGAAVALGEIQYLP
jgi:Tfp pilus assembly protein FimT